MNDSYEWVNKVIESCHNSFHLDCAKKLVEYFREKYGEGDQYNSLLETLVAKEPMIMIS